MVDIRFCGYNIRNGRNGGLNSALCMIVQANMDFWVLFEMKIMGRIYTYHSSEYNVLLS